MMSTMIDDHFNAVMTTVNIVPNLSLRLCNAVTMASAMPLTISAYSVSGRADFVAQKSLQMIHGGIFGPYQAVLQFLQLRILGIERH